MQRNRTDVTLGGGGPRIKQLSVWNSLGTRGEVVIQTQKKYNSVRGARVIIAKGDHDYIRCFYVSAYHKGGGRSSSSLGVFVHTSRRESGKKKVYVSPRGAQTRRTGLRKGLDKNFLDMNHLQGERTTRRGQQKKGAHSLRRKSEKRVHFGVKEKGKKVLLLR